MPVAAVIASSGVKPLSTSSSISRHGASPRPANGTLECPPTTMRAPSSAARRASRFMFANPAAIIAAVSAWRLCGRRIGAALEHGQRRDRATDADRAARRRAPARPGHRDSAARTSRTGRRGARRCRASTACRYFSRSRGGSRLGPERGDCSMPCSPASSASRASRISRCAVHGMWCALQTSITAFGARQRQPEVDFQRGRALARRCARPGAALRRHRARRRRRRDRPDARRRCAGRR